MIWFNLINKKMDLEQEFKKETGFDAYIDNNLEPKIPMGYYVEWLEAKIDYAQSCEQLNNCFKVGENVKYLGVEMKITFVDNFQKTANMYCMCDETNCEAVSLSKLKKII